jgi:excisionase family DNA binding protein
VARIFGVSVSTVTRWAQHGLLPAVRTPGGHYRFSVAAVKRAAEEAGLTDLGELDK